MFSLQLKSLRLNYSKETFKNVSQGKEQSILSVMDNEENEGKYLQTRLIISFHALGDFFSARFNFHQTVLTRRQFQCSLFDASLRQNNKIFFY